MKLALSLILSLIVGQLACAKVKVTRTAEQQLMESLEQGTVEVSLKIIKSKKIDLNYQGHQKMTPLMMAAILGQEQVVDELLTKKVDLELKNEVGDTALAVAVGNEQNAISNKLIKAGAKLDISCGDSSNTLMMCAVQTNNLSLLKTLINKVPKMKTAKNKEGQTASDLAKELNNLEALKLLKSAK